VPDFVDRQHPTAERRSAAVNHVHEELRLGLIEASRSVHQRLAATTGRGARVVIETAVAEDGTMTAYLVPDHDDGDGPRRPRRRITDQERALVHATLRSRGFVEEAPEVVDPEPEEMSPNEREADVRAARRRS
jgi:hypothetical protein